MGKIIFVTGGARSGKSAFAEKKAEEGGKHVAYIATAIAFDEEMKERVENHKKRRPSSWVTFEEPYRPGEIIKPHMKNFEVLLLDCLTVMISNLMLTDRDWDRIKKEEISRVEEEIEEEVRDLLIVLKKFRGTSIIVSNELGMGIVPVTLLGRVFRDVAGKMNQIVAGEADEVYFLVSGIPLKVNDIAHRGTGISGTIL